jgi:serine/threonine protein kinase
MQKSNSNHFGTQLSDYEILGQLGRGATAFVYKVRCRRFGGIYALKVVDKENLREKNLVQRIKQEI